MSLGLPQLRPEELTGRPSGGGRYASLSVAEIHEGFERCVEDPSMRSINAILRICREQIIARGNMGTYPVMAVALLVLPLLAGVAVVVVAKPEQRQSLLLGCGGLLVFDAVLWWGVFQVRHQVQISTRQVAEIERLAASAIAAILRNEIRLRPLQREQVDTVRDLIKKTGRDELRVLLEVE